MTSNTRTTKIGAGVLTLALLLGVAPAASAQTPLPAVQGVLCSQIDQIAARITGSIGTREGNFYARRGTRQNTVDARIEMGRKKTDDARKTHDDKRAERYAKLEARATTDAQRAAVVTFKAEVEAAVATRKAAVDAALRVSKNDTMALRASTETQVDAAIDTFTTAVDAAIAEAKSNCVDGVLSDTVRAELKADLQDARAELKATRSSIHASVQGELQEIRATRKAAVDAAFATFKASLDAASAKLKVAFHGSIE